MLLRILLSTFVLLPTAVLAQDTAGHRVTLDHVTLQWTETPSHEEIAGVTEEVLRQHARVAELLDAEPPAMITIVLGGPAQQPDGSWQTPRVDWLGRVLLFRYTNEYSNYFSALPHELVHAFRFDRRTDADWFFEEGFAEFIALRADSSLAGFPWFDYPVPVVAGQWLASGEAIPLALLRDRHKQLNRACRAQAYALRSAFFVWLGDSFGDDKVLEAANQSPAGALQDYERFFGKPFEALAKEWRAAALAQYDGIADAREQAKRFRTQSPIQYQNVCEQGEDF